MAYALVLSVVAHFLYIFVVYLFAQLLGVQVLSVFQFVLASCIGFILTAVPIAPGGVGVGQAAFLYAFGLFGGVSENLGAVFITGLQILFFMWSLLGLYYYLKSPPMKG